jgi:hypothetical protein
MRWKRGHQKARASDNRRACEMPGADLDQRRGGIGRQRRGKGLGELAERTVDDDAAVGSARWQIDGVELAQFENMLGIDGVRVAQPAFDLRDRRAPSAARHAGAAARACPCA